MLDITTDIFQHTVFGVCTQSHNMSKCIPHARLDCTTLNVMYLHLCTTGWGNAFRLTSGDTYSCLSCRSANDLTTYVQSARCWVVCWRVRTYVHTYKPMCSTVEKHASTSWSPLWVSLCVCVLPFYLPPHTRCNMCVPINVPVIIEISTILCVTVCGVWCLIDWL